MSWNESVKFTITGRDGFDYELEIETDSDKGVYFYIKGEGNDAKREFLGSTTLEQYIEVCKRQIALWEAEVSTTILPDTSGASK